MTKTEYKLIFSLHRRAIKASQTAERTWRRCSLRKRQARERKRRLFSLIREIRHEIKPKIEALRNWDDLFISRSERKRGVGINMVCTHEVGGYRVFLP